MSWPQCTDQEDVLLKGQVPSHEFLSFPVTISLCFSSTCGGENSVHTGFVCVTLWFQWCSLVRRRGGGGGDEKCPHGWSSLREFSLQETILSSSGVWGSHHAAPQSKPSRAVCARHRLHASSTAQHDARGTKRSTQRQETHLSPLASEK